MKYAPKLSMAEKAGILIRTSSNLKIMKEGNIDPLLEEFEFKIRLE